MISEVGLGLILRSSIGLIFSFAFRSSKDYKQLSTLMGREVDTVVVAEVDGWL